MSPRHPASLFPLLCLAAPLFAQGGEVDLRVATKKGASVWLVQEAKQENTMEAMGQQIETAHTVKHTLHLTVKEVDDKGNATVETTIARIQGTVSMPQPYGESEFDSLDPAADEDGDDAAMMTKGLMVAAGKTFTVKVDGNGKVVEFLADANKAIAEAKGAGVIGTDALSKESMTQLVEGTFGLRPDKPTTPGSKWPHTKRSGGNQLPFDHKLELTLSKVEADSFEITAAGTVDKPEAAEASAVGNEEEKAELEMLTRTKISNGKISGTQKVSRQDGFVLESTNTVSMDMEMGGSPMGDVLNSMKLTVSTKRTTEADAMKKADSKPAEPAKEEKKAEGKEEPKEEK